jgi:CubicO group peptidase (beta-lactamase class C family)
MVAGRIAEVVTGQEFNDLMREQLLKPIGATTAVFHSHASKELLAQIPTMYERQEGRLVKVDIAARAEAGATFPMPGGSLVSTLDDVSRLLLLHRNHGIVAEKTLIAPKTLQELYCPQQPNGRNGYGLGFNIMRSNENGVGTRIRHTGASGTLAMLDFKQDLIVVMLTQVPTRQTQPFANRLAKAIDSIFTAR